jgi:hypothetical protein
MARERWDEIQRPFPVGLAAAGTARPALPVSQFANDFSLVVRYPRRLRVARSKVYVLS